jgi:hypothetical protein
MYIAYVEGIQKFAQMHIETVKEAHLWVDTYRVNSAQLMITVARFLDKRDDSVCIHSLIKILENETDDIAWKLDGAKSRIPKLATELRFKFENLPSATEIRKHRDWVLAHNDRKVALGINSVSGIPYVDLKTCIDLLDEASNAIRGELENSETKMRETYNLTVTELSLSIGQAVYAFEANRENPREYRETQQVKNIMSEIQSLTFEV